MKIKQEDLKKSEEIDDYYETEISIDNQEINIILETEDTPLENIIKMANKILANFEQYNIKAKDFIVKEYLELYNDTWREEENPRLNAEEFKEKLTLDSIDFSSEEDFEFWYDDDDMFLGHFLVASSSDGENFDYAYLLG